MHESHPKPGPWHISRISPKPARPSTSLKLSGPFDETLTLMASTRIRSINRTSVSSLKSFITKSKVPANRSQSPFFTPSPSLTRRFRFTSRSPVELGCIDVSLFPKLSATATARLTSPMSLTSRSFSSLSQGT